MSSWTFQHPRLGPVHVTERRGSAKLSSRWVGGLLHVNIPAGAPREYVEDSLCRLENELERIRPRVLYNIGSRIVIPSASGEPNALEINILSSQRQSGDLTITVRNGGTVPGFVISLRSDIDITGADVQRRIDNCMKTLAKKIAPEILLPRARQLAERLGLKVEKWEIAHGRNVLGTCYPSSRRIRLSYLNVFLSPELRDFIICHELAHLTEPGHTPAFHTLCNRYCNGNEKRLIRALHTWKWPVMR